MGWAGIVGLVVLSWMNLVRLDKFSLTENLRALVIIEEKLYQ